jgi:hypothetical protein
VDVTTLRMTPTLSLSARPSVTLVVLNGGIHRIDVTGDVRRRRMIPNRCWSVTRHVGPRSHRVWREGDLPPPRALGMCGRNPVPATAVMGRDDRRRRRRECSEDSSAKTQARPLDSHRFIDAQRSLKNELLAVSLWPLARCRRRGWERAGGRVGGGRLASPHHPGLKPWANGPAGKAVETALKE